jgi:tryptophan synthase beta chain
VSLSAPAGGATVPALVPDAGGHFGSYGGRFVPESLISALTELDAQYTAAKADPAFQAELSALLRGYAGRPTLLTPAPRFSAAAGCAVLLKREDLAHTGSHKINPGHRRDRSRAARGRRRHRLCPVRPGMRRLHG